MTSAHRSSEERREERKAGEGKDEEEGSAAEGDEDVGGGRVLTLVVDPGLELEQSSASCAYRGRDSSRYRRAMAAWCRPGSALSEGPDPVTSGAVTVALPAAPASAATSGRQETSQWRVATVS